MDKKFTVAELRQKYSEMSFKDNSLVASEFNALYGIEALKALSDDDLVIRLFGKREYTENKNLPVSLAKWLESGSYDSQRYFGRARENGYVGLSVELPEEYFYYDYAKSKGEVQTKITKDEAIKYSKVLLNAFAFAVDLINTAKPSKIEDYQEAYKKIQEYLANTNEKNLYWTEAGTPKIFFLKYLHCVCPKYFSETYAQSFCRKILDSLNVVPVNEKNSFLMNAQILLYGNQICASSDQFEQLLVEVGAYSDNETDFKAWFSEQVKSNGEPYSSVKQYCKGISDAFKEFKKETALSKFKKYKSIYEIDSVDEITEYIASLESCEGFADYNESHGKRTVSNGLKKYKEYLETRDSSKEGKTMTTAAKKNSSIKSQNTILYGPPGTGKTYSTVTYAVSIVEGKPLADIQKEAQEDYKAVFDRYTKLKEQGFIDFVTFHQSYGYEDFIEGIKPVIDDSDASNLQYTIEPGIFKKFCEKAEAGSAKSTAGYGFNEYPTIWKVSLQKTGDNPVRKECLEKGHIRIGWDEYGEDLSGEINEGKAILNAFYSNMRKGDIIFSCYTASTIDAIGVVIGDPEWHDEYPEYKRLRNVNWIVKDIKEDITKLNNGKSMTLSTVYKLNIPVSAAIDLIEKNADDSSDKSVVSNNKYVFIIDEINRGNISKIFGELLTLIEPNKRLGASEGQTVTLPYSKTSFGVPANVYILGTMNTADRSIALMDTALRRRFDFDEIMPNPELLKGVNVDGLDIESLLDRLNKKITVLFDREHTIGHAYFMGLKENPTEEALGDIFLHKVFPLLQEYFYDDYAKIRSILGDTKEGKEETLQFVQTAKGYEGLFSDTEFTVDETQYCINEDAFYNVEAYKSI